MKHGLDLAARPPRLRLRFTGARVLRDGALQSRSLAIAGGRITKGPLPEVDLSGFYILPGIVDALFRPPPGVAGARAIAQAAAAQGITTAWHPLGWSWAGGSEAPETAQGALAETAAAARRGALAIDLRPALLCERHTVASREALLAAVRRYGVDLVLFTDRLAQLEPHLGRLPADLARRLERARQETPEVPRHLCRLAEAFDTLGTLYGSLGDADGETRETWSMIGATLCVAPVHRSAAALARAVGDPVLLPAPDAAAASATCSRPGGVPAGLATGFVSGPRPGAQAAAAFALAQSGAWSLPAAWARISACPAADLRLPDRGSIAPGRRADLAIVDAATRRVAATISDGRLAYLARSAADRFAVAAGDILAGSP